MISTLLFILFLVVAAGWAVSTRENAFIDPDPNNRYSQEKLNLAWLKMPLIILITGLLIALLQPYSVQRVDAGSVGVKAELTGDERGVSKYEYKNGWVTYNNWTEQLFEYAVFQQHVEYDTIETITKGGFPAKITPSFNYALVAGSVGDMFQNLRKPLSEIEQGWLKNAIFSSVNDIANKWTVDSIFNDRERFESSIVAECNKRVSKWFTVSQLRSNITPPGALQTQIAEKSKSILLAQGELLKAVTAKAAAEVKIATAKGDSAQAVINAGGIADAAVIAAEGEAKAMKAKQRELSQTYIDYIRASNWNGVYPTTILGGNSGTLLNLK
jgi:regulator of protease activity HflC (stomatin/prohibitin superfamily)